MVTDDTLRVLAIAGWGRCGSTLLDMMLGQLDGFVSAGEVREVWLRGCRENRPCGCGHAFADCPFWTEVGDRAFGGWAQLDLDRVLAVRYGIDRLWRVPQFALDAEGVAPRQMLAGSDRHRGRDLLPRRARPARACPSRAVSGARVVIDSSKLRHGTRCCCQRAPRLYVPRRAPRTRQPWRGVLQPASVVLKLASSGRSDHCSPVTVPVSDRTARYDLYNGLQHVFPRRGDLLFVRMRYEDLVPSPVESLRRLAELARSAGSGVLAFFGQSGSQLGSVRTTWSMATPCASSAARSGSSRTSPGSTPWARDRRAPSQR